ncbi:MAG TPA: DNA-3-methyladenine glycosylase [Humisphaera sp.]|jgi:DNA-3-methyladenine glycosylase|nr:DNA-3-methyladenine glycosylase [Humisphaera sp.]
MPRKLGYSFYRRSADVVAAALIGKILVHRCEQRDLRARIVETEAYMGPKDLASHSSKGRTKRTEVMFGPAGRAYVYFIYGMHEMFNIVAGKTGEAHAVLLRAAEPLDGWSANLTGPGRLARAMQITRADYGLDLTGDILFLEHNPSDRPRVISTYRVGVDYAGVWKDKPLRFLDADSRAVSKPWPRTDLPDASRKSV